VILLSPGDDAQIGHDDWLFKECEIAYRQVLFVEDEFWPALA
jgi:hypothetical protein